MVQFSSHTFNSTIFFTHTYLGRANCVRKGPCWNARVMRCPVHIFVFIAALAILGQANAGDRTPAPAIAKVEVGTDTALLKALKSPNVTNIVLTSDIVLGEIRLRPPAPNLVVISRYIPPL